MIQLTFGVNMIRPKSPGDSDSLDKTIPPTIKVNQVRKKLKNPDFDKWFAYRRKDIMPFTLNPWDGSRSSPFGTTWGNSETSSKRRQVIAFFRNYNNTFEDYFITFEFSDAGRFHCHGLIYLYENQRINRVHFNESIRFRFGNKYKRNACFKGVPMNSLSDDAFTKSYNYCTKDIQYMYNSMYKIKYFNKKKNTLVIEKNKQIKTSSNLL